MATHLKLYSFEQTQLAIDVIVLENVKRNISQMGRKKCENA